jgi:hypothetical protein
LKSFILDEEAQIMDKTATKVALTASFFAASFAFNIEDANAKGHANYTTHSNNFFHEGRDAKLGNNQNESITRTYSMEGRTLKVEVDGKQVATAHGNHYNHVNGSGKS